MINKDLKIGRTGRALKVRVQLLTGHEHLVALQQVTEGEICGLVLGTLPEPDAVAFDDQRHGKQLVRVVDPGHVDEAPVGVDQVDEVDRGFGEHDAMMAGRNEETESV